MSAIFGGSKSKQKSTSQSTSQSYNQAYPYIRDTYAPTVNTGNSAISSIAALLGLGGDKAGADAAYNNYLNSTDYARTTAEGNRAITSNNAARGLLGSGATLKALNTFGQQNQQKYFSDYIAKLLSLGAAGLQAGQLIGGTGSTSNSQSTSASSGTGGSSNGIGGFLGTIGAGIAMSDRRLKKAIVKITTEADGLGLYEWTYVNGTERHRGYMADEVAVIRPWALGPRINGFMTVDYGKVKEAA